MQPCSALLAWELATGALDSEEGLGSTLQLPAETLTQFPKLLQRILGNPHCWSVPLQLQLAANSLAVCLETHCQRSAKQADLPSALIPACTQELSQPMDHPQGCIQSLEDGLHLLAIDMLPESLLNSHWQSSSHLAVQSAACPCCPYDALSQPDELSSWLPSYCCAQPCASIPGEDPSPCQSYLFQDSIEIQLNSVREVVDWPWLNGSEAIELETVSTLTRTQRKKRVPPST